MTDNLMWALLSGETAAARRDYLVTATTEQPAHVADDYAALRHHVFVDTQQLFEKSDRDAADEHPATTVLVAVAPDGTLLGGVRIAPVVDPGMGWWAGSRLVLSSGVRGGGVGRALIRAACAWVESAGGLRFDATIQDRYHGLFTDLGWTTVGHTVFGGAPHTRVRWPIDRFARLAAATKSVLGSLLVPFAGHPAALGPNGFRGDDGVPIGNGMVAACDAIAPTMVARDPEWAGWCGALVNLNDLAAMGASATGMLDAVAAPSASHATRVVRGLADASTAWNVPVLGGHTQIGVPAALSVTAFGQTTAPIPGGGARPGDALTVSADVSGQWRPGYTGHQWDSTSRRDQHDLRHLAGLVNRTAPQAAKDVSMAGLIGTVGMMAEASAAGAVITITDVPKPAHAQMGDWLSCFPGFAMITADIPGRGVVDPGPATTAACGSFHHRTPAEPLVAIRWPDGETTTAISGTVTGLGASHREELKP
ncbi:MAG: MSMEG_0567/sll0787 family protein [Mycobacterium sp.]